MPGGFLLRRLTLRGSDIPDAEVQFSRGLNVIVGPSDTGKTFIAQCINFMLGAKDAPKEIPEATPYESVLLLLNSYDETQEFLLERSLRGGDFNLYIQGQHVKTLGAIHQVKNEDTVSHFLLNLTGLIGRKVKENKLGKTRTLSFRDLVKFVLINEEIILSDKSPIFSGQNTTRTVENSVFRLLLTGVDDSSVIAKEDPKVSKVRREGKFEIIHVLLKRTEEKINDLELDGNEVEVRKQLEQMEMLSKKVSSKLAIEKKSFAELEEQRRSCWTHLRTVQSKINVLAELQGRFELLLKQYKSDLRRLESISEAGGRLGQMQEERCPVCGALAKHYSSEHQKPNANPEEIVKSCQTEANKIRLLLDDLHDTLASNSADIRRLNNDKDEKQNDLNRITEDLKNRIQPRVQAILKELEENHTQRDFYHHALELFEQKIELENLIQEVGKPESRQVSAITSTTVGADEAEQFSKEVESQLRAWHFPNLDRVTFSEDEQDIVISGQRRTSHGKGVRAITHAAFKLALLNYCWTLSMPHPGFVLIDSPLVVYREPDTEEGGFTPDVKDAFYQALAKDFAKNQVIILENEDPSSDLDEIANIIHFTGTNQGRKGFIP